MRRTVSLIFVIASALTLAACSHASKQSAPTPTTAPPAARFANASCTAPLPAGQTAANVRCGVLTVPENREVSDGRTIQLAVAILKSTSPTPDPDPMLYLSGGPGQANLTGNMQWFSRNWAAPLQANRDLVFFDQRGTGLSRPLLTCPEVDTAFKTALAANLTAEEESNGQVAVMRQCHDRLAREGVDFTAYSSKESAADVADLMQALGYDRYNIYGVSYGSRLALEVMRDHPQHVRSVVLDSTVLPQGSGPAAQAASFDRAINVMIAGCKANPACAKAYPTLEQTFFDLVNKANASPITVEPKDPATGEPTTVVVNGDRILAGAFSAFYNTSLLPLLPFAANAIADGNTAILTTVAAQVATNGDVAQAMGEAVTCNDVTMSLTPQEVATAIAGVRPAILAAHIGITDDADLKSAQDLCRAFGITQVGTQERQPVVSDVPTLVLAGEYDPITPPANGRTVADAFSHSFYFLFPGSGHGELFERSDCALALAASFFNDPAKAPGAGCIAGLAEPNFLAQ